MTDFQFKNETSPPVRSNARSSRACVREEATASNSRNFFGSSIQVQNSSTMPSRITNPFDSDITRSMQTITLSPSLFDHPKNSDDDDGDNAEASFRWSIGQIAELRPANIDETQLLYQTPDPVQEAQIHSAIDKFWATQKYIVPSPQVLKESGIRKSVASPSSLSSLPRLVHEVIPSFHLDDSPDGRKFYHQRSQSKRSVEIQTMFTFPPNLDLVGLLGNCFQYEEGAVAVFEANLSLNTLRQKLFTDTVSSRTESSSSDKFESHVSSILFEGEPPAWYHSDDEIVPLRKLSIDDATDFDEKEISNRLSSPDLSPIKK
ncbi:unnamed protein product [Thelazia callipaeda]|uniref:Protein aurora borealis n=1 Tax=Thelazia callipaeda TaxID=103827 RepID=A0A0N5DB43_THECL|nr:unnamed protein product [Thelazia callipaeda]